MSIKDLKAHDDRIFEEYYIKYYPQVYRYLFRKVGNQQVAEDLTMDAFLSCLENFSKFDPQKASFQTWLYVIVNNRLKNYYRDKKECVDIDLCYDLATESDDGIEAAIYLSFLREHSGRSSDVVRNGDAAVVVTVDF